MLLLHQVENVGSQLQDLFVSLGVLCTLDQRTLFVGEHHFAIVGFRIEGQAVKERTLVDVLVLTDFEEIHFTHFGIASSIVRNQTAILSLDQSVDANIFDNVEGVHCNLFGNASIF